MSDSDDTRLTRFMEVVPWVWIPVVVLVAIFVGFPVPNFVVADLALQAQAAFLVATLAIVSTIYVLQWSYFEHKPSTYEKVRAARHTLAVFWCEFVFVILAFTALGLIALAAVGLYSRVAALVVGWIVSAMFLLLVLAEMFTSIRAIWGLQGETANQTPSPPLQPRLPDLQLRADHAGQVGGLAKASYATASGSASDDMSRPSETAKHPEFPKRVALFYSAFAVATLILAASQAFRSGLDEPQLSTFFSASLSVSGALIVAIFLFAAEYGRAMKERPRREMRSLAWWLICAFAITSSGLFFAVFGILHGFDSLWNATLVTAVLLSWAGAIAIIGAGVRVLMTASKEA